jgi:hypothetical protein
MDYAEQLKIIHEVNDFTFYKYLNLKRKPPKVKTKPETKPLNCSASLLFNPSLIWDFAEQIKTVDQVNSFTYP